MLTCIFEKDLVHVGAGVLEQLVVRVEDDDGDLAVAEDTQLVGLLHQPELSLGERHLTISLVGDALDGYLLSTHASLLLWFESCFSRIEKHF